MDFAKLVAGSPLAPHRERLQQLLRPACDIVHVAPEAGLGRSRFGGSPDRPRGADWPSHRLGPYRFLGQINFGEVPSQITALPKSGLLSLFFAEDPDGELDWLDEGYIHAEYYGSTSALAPQTPPENVRRGTTTGIVLRPTVDLPFDEYQMAGWELKDDELAAYDTLREALHESGDYLLGYPSHCTLAYDPTPGPDHLSLITLSSDEDLEWVWHDGDKLMVFIERARLEQASFSRLRADAG